MSACEGERTERESWTGERLSIRICCEALVLQKVYPRGMIAWAVSLFRRYSL